MKRPPRRGVSRDGSASQPERAITVRYVHPSEPPGAPSTVRALALDDGRLAVIAVGHGATDEPRAAIAERALNAACSALRNDIDHDAMGRTVHALSEQIRLLGRSTEPRHTGAGPSSLGASLLVLRLSADATETWCLACGEVELHLLDTDGEALPLDPRLTHRPRTPLPDGYTQGVWCRLDLPLDGHVVLTTASPPTTAPPPRALLDSLADGAASNHARELQGFIWLSLGRPRTHGFT